MNIKRVFGAIFITLLLSGTYSVGQARQLLSTNNELQNSYSFLQQNTSLKNYSELKSTSLSFRAQPNSFLSEIREPDMLDSVQINTPRSAPVDVYMFENFQDGLLNATISDNSHMNQDELMFLFVTGKNPSSFQQIEHPSDYLRIQSNQQINSTKSSLHQALTTKPGYAFLGSAIVPGLSQAANKQYWKTALYIVAEAATIYLAIDGNRRGKKLERDYINIGDQDWSVVKYAAWVHNYYHNVPGARESGAPNIDITTLLTPAGLEEYNRQGGFPMPLYDTDTEWKWINIQALRQLERSSLYLTSGRPFSHDLPDFGSQQYYELMSKYYQFAPGWRDWNDNNHNVNAGLSGMSPMWLHHTHLEERFNDSYRFAGNMLTLMVVNHVISAFDAYFTIKLKNHKLQSGMVYSPGSISYQLTYKF